MKTKYNYPELGGVDSQRIFYNKNDEIIHPSGVVYVRINGNWTIKKEN